MKVDVLCENCEKECKKTFKGICTLCVKKDEIISYDIEKVAKLLNTSGVVVFRACPGIRDGFDRGLKNYPWIELCEEEDNIYRARVLMNDYNEAVGKEKDVEWVVRGVEDLLGKRREVITPKKIEKNTESLSASVKFLEKFLEFSLTN